MCFLFQTNSSHRFFLIPNSYDYKPPVGWETIAFCCLWEEKTRNGWEYLKEDYLTEKEWQHIANDLKIDFVEVK